MDKENGIRLAITAAFVMFCAYFQALVVPLTILIGIMIVDYATGLAKAYISESLSSRIGIKGILKKLGYIILVVCAMAVDYLIKVALFSTGIVLPESFTIALLVIIWLIINEVISILENLAIMGVHMPNWLVKLVKKLKVVAENKGEEITKTESEE